MVMMIGPRAGVIRSASAPAAQSPGDRDGGAKASEVVAAPPTGPRFGAPLVPGKP
jgi:hypothetical protein